MKRSVWCWMLPLLALALLPSMARAHCDGLDGPVVKAAEAALERGTPEPALVWVHADAEPELRDAFRRAVALRKSGPEARALADRWFFETLVRLHRAGEGAAYTGLQPAGRDLGPVIPAADRAVASGELAPLRDLLVQALDAALARQFAEVRAARDFAPTDVARGREFVARYVQFVHMVEALHATVAPGTPAAGEPHRHEHP